MRVRGDCASAIPLFQKAHELYPSGLGSLRNLAECEQALGHFASARRTWLELGRALLTNDDRKYAGWAQDADQAAAALLPKVASLTIDVTVVTPSGETLPTTGIDMTLNGEAVAPNLVGVLLERDPGTYVVRVTEVGLGAPQEETVQLRPGESKRVSLQVVASPEPRAADLGAPPAAIETAPAPPAPATHGPPRSADRKAAWIALGVGAAGLVGMGVSLIVRQDALNEVRSNCPQFDTGSCGASSQAAVQSAVQSAVNRGHTASTFVNVFGAVAVVGAIGGVVLLATKHSQGGARAALVLSPAGLSTMGRF